MVLPGRRPNCATCHPSCGLRSLRLGSRSLRERRGGVEGSSCHRGQIYVRSTSEVFALDREDAPTDTEADTLDLQYFPGRCRVRQRDHVDSDLQAQFLSRVRPPSRTPSSSVRTVHLAREGVAPGAPVKKAEKQHLRQQQCPLRVLPARRRVLATQRFQRVFVNQRLYHHQLGAGIVLDQLGQTTGFKKRPT